MIYFSRNLRVMRSYALFGSGIGPFIELSFHILSVKDQEVLP